MSRNVVLGITLAVAVAVVVLVWRCSMCERTAPPGDGQQPAVEVVQPTSEPAVVAPEAIVPAPAVPAAVSPAAAGVAAAVAAAARAQPWESKRIRPFPRKKKTEWEVDLDGDGLAEKLVVTQHAAADSWTGGDSPGGPSGTLEVHRGAGGQVALERRKKGYALGMFGLPARIGQGRHVVFALEAEADGPSELPGWVTVGADGKIGYHSMKRVPLELLDLSGSGRDAVTTLSTELYLEFLVTGTMDIMRWHGGKFQSLLPFKAFEVCALEPDGGLPLLVVAVTRKKHTLHLLKYDGTDERLVSVWRVKVSPPEDRSKPYNVPRGFALACSFPNARPHRVQYRNRVFNLSKEGDALVEGPRAKRPGQ